jgi:hypothetical protein
MRPWTVSECNNGIRGRGLTQKPQGRIGIKDPDAKLQLRLRIEQMSDGIDVKIFRLENEKRTAESFMGVTKNEEMYPSRNEISCRYRRNRSSRATDSNYERERERKLRIIVLREDDRKK